MSSLYPTFLRWFQYDHLPQHLHGVSRIFKDAAVALYDRLPVPSEERDVALRKLLEAKDAAVRARLAEEVKT